MTAPEIHPLTPERWPDLEALFGPNGASGGCWCMLWRLSAKAWTDGKGAANREGFRARVHGARPPGLLAYAEGRPVGWISIAPRAEFPRMAGSRVLAPVDDAPVWSVSCFFLKAGWRRQGLSRALLEAACQFAAGAGAETVEGYPVDPLGARYGAGFAWTGFLGTFLSCGFTEIARRSEKRPILRRQVQSLDVGAGGA